MSDDAPKTTPLYEEHVRLGGKMIPFGGWLMPVQYSSIMEEHQAVRNSVGVFDISHMGELVVTGPRAGEWLNTMLTNNTARLEIGAGQYTFLLNDDAGIIDDLIVYRIEDQKFLLVVNASRTEDDFAWLRSHLPGSPTPAIADGVRLENQSDRYAGLAIQGPRIGELFRALFGEGKELPARNQIAQFDLGGAPLWVARTGYTGEDGIEVFFRRDCGTARLERSPGTGEVVRYSALRTRRARYVASGNVLSPQWLRPFPGAQPARSRSCFFRRPDKAKFYRPREVAARKGNRFVAPARSFPDERQEPAAPATLSRLPRGRGSGRADERDAFAEFELRDRNGLPHDTGAEAGRRNRN